MNKRLIFLISIFTALLIYFTIFSIRSPFKDTVFPLLYVKTSREILPDPEPSPNTHEIVLKSGSNISGELISDDTDTYVLREHKKDQTSQDHTIKKSDALSIRVRPQALAVSSSEIIARKTFPKMKFYRLENYTLFSNSGYSSVGPTAGILKKLHRDLTTTFPDLIPPKNSANRICVVLFDRSENYKNFIRKINSAFVKSVGCYSPDHNILFINNDFSGQAGQSDSGNTIRHEGAHQIFYNAKLHYGWMIDRLWLVEGLAVYAEPVRLGEHMGFRQQRLKKALQQNQQFPLRKLLSTYSVHGKRSELFYDQSWALVSFLMNTYHDGFMEYLMYVKTHPFLSRFKGDAKLLERFLGKKMKVIETEWKNFWM